jgi:SAM-dependent methyltransferase
MSPRPLLRGVALLGTAAVLLQEVVSGFPLQPRQGWGVPLLILATLAVALATGVLMARAAGRLLRHPDLLVPLGLLTFTEGALGWVQRIPAAATLLASAKPMMLLGINLALSAGFVLSILLHVGYAAWVTLLILDVVRSDRADPVDAAARVPRWFPRVLALESLGWVVLFAGVALAIALAPVGGIVPALIVIGGWSLAWNLSTAALLLTALDGRLRIGEAIVRGLRVSWDGLRRWGMVVVVQLLLLGFVTFLYLSYTETTPGGFTTHTSTNWSVNGFWTGGYENGCRWYDKLMEALAAPKWPPVATALGLVFGVLAVLVKLHVTGLLPGDGGTPPSTHDDLIRDQFAKQAVPFATAPGIRDEAALRLLVDFSGAGPADTVLDVACGPGLVACAFARVVRHATGIDLTPAMIDQARALQQQLGLANVTWQVGDVRPLPFADGSFTIVTSRFAFHHLLEPRAVLEEMRRACAPGGRVVVVDVMASPDPAKAAAYNRMEKLRDPSHARALTLAELEALFPEVGLPAPRTTFYRLECDLEGVLQRSFPNPGDTDRIRQLFAESLDTDGLGVGAHRQRDEIRFAYPVAILLSANPGP